MERNFFFQKSFFLFLLLTKDAYLQCDIASKILTLLAKMHASFSGVAVYHQRFFATTTPFPLFNVWHEYIRLVIDQTNSHIIEYRVQISSTKNVSSLNMFQIIVLTSSNYYDFEFCLRFMKRKSCSVILKWAKLQERKEFVFTARSTNWAWKHFF